MLQALVSGRRVTRTPRAEFTCEWLDRPLVDFARSRDKVLTISAEAGSGKSYLFGWILERLQRRVGHKDYQVVSAVVDSQVPDQATQIALVKSLLLQLLEQNVGNVTLFRCLANVTELGTNTSSIEDAEDALWFTLDTALQGLENVVIVVDGLDSLEGDDDAKLHAFEHLYDIANKNKHNVRVIVLTRPLSKPWPKPARQVAMTPQRTTADVKHMVRAWLIRRNFGTKQEIEDISEQMAQRSKGSLTWTDMSLQLLANAKNVAEVTTTIKELPSTTNEILTRHVQSISPLKGDARLIISWLLASKRPLSTVEIQTLLELDTKKTVHSPRSTDIVADIKQSCGSLVIVQDKTVRFRNEAVRLYLLELSKTESKDAESGLLSLADAHKDLTARLLLYVKTCVTRNVDSSLEKISSREVDSHFKTHPLLEYATRNWLDHFKNSSFYASGQVQVPLVTGELTGVFPNSTLLARLEQKCWDKQTLASNANASNVLALTVRQNTLGENAQSTLQSCINVAQSFKKISAPAEASKYFYKAAKIGQSVLGRTNDLAVSCATASLDISASIKEKAVARDDNVTQREELLKYVIDTEKQRSGGNATSAVASKYTNELAELYTNLKENEKAEAVYRDVYKTSIAQNGQFSAEATRAAEKLQTVLYKEAKHEEVVKYTQPIFENAQRNLDIFDIRRVEITLRMADTYEKKKDFTHAEELYITLWRGLTEYCRSTVTATATAATIAEAHERKIQISLAYAKFLRRQGREAEAQNILHGVWLDYQQMTNKSEAVAKQLNLVGEELKSMGILDVAIAVFKSVWGYFKGSGTQNSAAAVGTAVALMGAVQEKSEKKQAEVVKTKAAAAKNGVIIDVSHETDSDVEEDDVDDDEADAILDEVIKTAIAAPAAAVATEAGKNDNKTREVEVVTIESQIQTCETLSGFYVSKKKWTECIEVCAQLLKQLWPELGSSGSYGFPRAFRNETIRFTRRIAFAYAESNQTEQALKMYAAIFQASLRSGLKIQDQFVTESANELIEFHKKTQQWSKVLAVYQQLLEGYKTSLGSRNALTIKTLYIMGDLCVQYRLKGADAYYLELVKTDKNAEGVVSKDTLPAAIALSKIYYEQKRWNELRPVYAALWTTFTKRGKEYGMSTELVQTIYKRYVTVLQTYLKVDIEVVRKIAVEVRIHFLCLILPLCPPSSQPLFVLRPLLSHRLQTLSLVITLIWNLISIATRARRSMVPRPISLCLHPWLSLPFLASAPMRSTSRRPSRSARKSLSNPRSERLLLLRAARRARLSLSTPRSRPSSFHCSPLLSATWPVSTVFRPRRVLLLKPVAKTLLEVPPGLL